MEYMFYIKNPRQLRVILTLLEKPTPVKDMAHKIGALNPRQVVSELKHHQGFKGVILTRRYSIIDQDGKRCRPGEYYIPQEFKPILEEALKEGGSLSCFKKSGIRQHQTLIKNNKEAV